ncbi:1-aminocyclopropane-1-carboxylate deaminase [Campylobacter mucosalis]|uniref:1-aminocyclopropane-1-carboxylate deaminase n=1 Tax=Campylobacter mucosalis TaxID=202 RepID=UPI00146FCC03|nr:1-aminocyclopropane-1-carboxylate deaminase [Campylobacter mucosalis]
MIERFKFKGKNIWLLRDDLLGVFNGNKARKLEYFLTADLSKFQGIISHGSSQSNAMQSLSVFAKMKGLDFHYVVSHLNSNLKQNPLGNFKSALDNGMILHINENREETAKNLAKQYNLLFIKEGVAMSEAEVGFKTQANFIKNFAEQNSIKFDIFLPSGTGTSACYLSKNIDFDVYTCPCVGDSDYLKNQILKLDKNSRVKILTPPKKYHFGDLKPELYKIWREVLDESGVEFELIYDPVGFLTLEQNILSFKNEILYIHQGGILGNQTQIQRYERKNSENFKHKTR